MLPLILALVAAVAFLYVWVARLERRIERLETPRVETPRAETPPPLPAQPSKSRDWESLIGGNWLNKLGALLLVVGIGLFLAYSLAHLGPAGKVVIGMAVGLSMLLAGLAMERKAQYATFARGFIAGGWAAIYFTTYAMHAFPAARVVDSPAVATGLLLLVSVLLLLHSFRYRSEAVTSLAYVISFLTLNLTPRTTFTNVSTLCLMLSLIAIAHRFSWHRLAITGVVLTYFTIGYMHGGRAMLWIAWIAFETYDALRQRTTVLFFLNAVGLIAAGLALESDWAGFFGMATVAYAGSTAVRAWLPARAYEAAASAMAVLAAAAIVARFSGVVMTTALFVEAEIIVFAGMTLRHRVLNTLGAVLFIVPLIHLVSDMAGTERWTPIAAAMAIAFFINYALLREQWWYMAAGSLLLLTVLDEELRGGFVTVAWGVAAALLVTAGFMLRDRITRLAGLAVFLLCVGRLFLFDVRRLDTLGRILSFILLGLILLGASWAYTRYREQIRRIL